jgi:Protein of unknown function (DUF3773).
MELSDILVELAQQQGWKFVYAGKQLAAEEAFKKNSLLPAMARRADKLCLFCLGYGIGVSFVESGSSMLGYEVVFDELAPNVLRVAFIYDVLVNLSKNSGSLESVKLDELLFG